VPGDGRTRVLSGGARIICDKSRILQSAASTLVSEPDRAPSCDSGSDGGSDSVGSDSSARSSRSGSIIGGDSGSEAANDVAGNHEVVDDSLDAKLGAGDGDKARRQILGGRARTLGIGALPVNIGNEKILSGGARILCRPPPVEAEPIAARAESRIWMQALNEDESDEYDSNADCTDTSGDADDARSDGEYDTSKNADDNQDAQLEGGYYDASSDDFASDEDCASNDDYNSNSSETDQHRSGRPDPCRSSVNARLEQQSPAQEEMAKHVTIMMVRIAMWGAILQRRYSEQEWDQMWCEKWNAARDMSNYVSQRAAQVMMSPQSDNMDAVESVLQTTLTTLHVLEKLEFDDCFPSSLLPPPYVAPPWTSQDLPPVFIGPVTM
jgi:uncharacterized protein YdaT